MKSVGTAYRQSNIGGPFDAIVIGSGMGGLAAAGVLAKHGGQRVLVLERHYTAGGFTHVFHRPGFEWDVGVHYIGQLHDPVSPVSRLFNYLTEGRLQWADMPEIYDRAILGGIPYDFLAGRERFREKMEDYFPAEAKAIDRYLKLVHSCARWSAPYFAEKAVPPVLSKLLGGFLRGPFLRYARLTTAEVLAELDLNPELAGVLTAQWGDYGLPPGESSFGIHAIVVEHYLDGGSYPRGGASRIARAIEPVIRRAGGQIVVSAEVAEVLVDRDTAIGVRMADGREFRSRVVISDAGPRNTLRLLPPLARALTAIPQILSAVPPSAAHLCLYVGLNGTARALGLKGTNLWVSPSAAHDENWRRFREDPTQPFPQVYISFPSAKDPEFERHYPGRSTIELIVPACYGWFQQWGDSAWKKRGPDYETFKQQWAERLLSVLYEHVPSARGRVVHAELSTPLSTRHFANHQQGEIYGLAHTPARFEMRRLGPRTQLRSLFLTGQDVAVCGVMGAAMGGILAASTILKKNMFSVVMRNQAVNEVGGNQEQPAYVKAVS